jgi:hypothetical protein
VSKVQLQRWRAPLVAMVTCSATQMVNARARALSGTRVWLVHNPAQLNRAQLVHTIPPKVHKARQRASTARLDTFAPKVRRLHSSVLPVATVIQSAVQTISALVLALQATDALPGRQTAPLSRAQQVVTCPISAQQAKTPVLCARLDTTANKVLRRQCSVQTSWSTRQQLRLGRRRKTSAFALTGLSRRPLPVYATQAMCPMAPATAILVQQALQSRRSAVTHVSRASQAGRLNTLAKLLANVQA